MKRRDILRALEAAGLTLKEGGGHTIVLRGTRRVSVVPPHSEVNDLLVLLIAKQTGVKLK